ncbi:hypothetical protein L596_000046 [Steinernema carpocapsae]|uniref:Uncharacterized protein n=1 Tax=Steinernema carpocapsae TaxID=34508 RepID=A0A4U8UJ22_STECR|nr:hypothetical protein L596_000046 [Steinernema carpocapsae]
MSTFILWSMTGVYLIPYFFALFVMSGKQHFFIFNHRNSNKGLKGAILVNTCLMVGNSKSPKVCNRTQQYFNIA